jgi:hypothetical protein
MPYFSRRLIPFVVGFTALLVRWPCGAYACEVSDVWLYFGANQTEAESSTRIRQFLCSNGDPYWFRIKWATGGEFDSFDVKLREFGVGVIYEEPEIDGDERDWTDRIASASQGEHRLLAAVRVPDGKWVWSDDTGNETYGRVFVNKDPGSDETVWTGAWGIGFCPEIGESCPKAPVKVWPGDGQTMADDCGHTLKVYCSPAGSGCCFMFYYDTTLVGWCPWINAGNGWQARRTSLKWGKRRWLETKHCSFAECGTETGPPSLPEPDGEGHVGFWCWRVQRYDCINNKNFALEWRKTQSTDWYPEFDWDETAGSCCDGTPAGRHPGYDGPGCP